MAAITSEDGRRAQDWSETSGSACLEFDVERMLTLEWLVITSRLFVRRLAFRRNIWVSSSSLRRRRNIVRSPESRLPWKAGTELRRVEIWLSVLCAVSVCVCVYTVYSVQLSLCCALRLKQLCLRLASKRKRNKKRAWLTGAASGGVTLRRRRQSLSSPTPHCSARA